MQDSIYFSPSFWLICRPDGASGVLESPILMIQVLSWTPFRLYKYHLFTQLIDYLLDVIDSRLYLLVTSFVLYIKQLIGRWWCIIPLFSPRSHYTSAVISPSFMDRLSFLYVSTSILPYNPFQRLLPCNSHYIACQEHVFQPYTSCMVSSRKQSKSNKGPGNSPPPPQCKHYCNFIRLQQQLAVAFLGNKFIATLPWLIEATWLLFGSIVFHNEACVLFGLCWVLSEPCVDKISNSRQGSVYTALSISMIVWNQSQSHEYYLDCAKITNQSHVYYLERTFFYKP